MAFYFYKLNEVKKKNLHSLKNKLQWKIIRKPRLKLMFINYMKRKNAIVLNKTNKDKNFRQMTFKNYISETHFFGLKIFSLNLISTPINWWEKNNFLSLFIWWKGHGNLIFFSGKIWLLTEQWKLFLEIWRIWFHFFHFFLIFLFLINLS